MNPNSFALATLRIDVLAVPLEAAGARVLPQPAGWMRLPERAP